MSQGSLMSVSSAPATSRSAPPVGSAAVPVAPAAPASVPVAGVSVPAAGASVVPAAASAGAAVVAAGAWLLAGASCATTPAVSRIERAVLVSSVRIIVGSRFIVKVNKAVWREDLPVRTLHGLMSRQRDSPAVVPRLLLRIGQE